MEELEIRKITELSKDNLNKMAKWIYDWWGKNEALTLEQMRIFLKSGLQENRIPQTYGAFIGNDIVGMYQFLYEDLFVRPDIYPWLANVYVDNQYRNKGICRKLMESVRENAKQNISFKELWLYTKHTNLYEKFGWEYVCDIDTYNEEQRIQRLYKMEL